MYFVAKICLMLLDSFCVKHFQEYFFLKSFQSDSISIGRTKTCFSLGRRVWFLLVLYISKSFFDKVVYQ